MFKVIIRIVYATGVKRISDADSGCVAEGRSDVVFIVTFQITICNDVADLSGIVVPILSRQLSCHFINLSFQSLTVTLITSLAMTASSILLANPIAHLFVGYDAELCDMTVNALRIYALSFLVCGFNIFGSAFFTGLNNGTASALISFLRTLVIQVAAVLLLPKLLGINGIWLAITVAEALTLIVTETLFLLGRKKYHYA